MTIFYGNGFGTIERKAVPTRIHARRTRSGHRRLGRSRDHRIPFFFVISGRRPRRRDENERSFRIFRNRRGSVVDTTIRPLLYRARSGKNAYLMSVRDARRDGFRGTRLRSVRNPLNELFGRNARLPSAQA